MDKKNKGEIEFCKNPEVNETMNEAFKMVNAVSFNNNSDTYLNEIYEVFANKMARDKKFLKDMECIYSRDLFKKILDKTEKYDVSNIKLNQIEPNDILLIKCPSIFAPYHFIIAVVNQDGNNVAIYQSFGSSRRLFKINLPYATFTALMGRLSTFKDDINFNEDYQMMTQEIEPVLYHINIPEYVAILTEHYEREQERNSTLMEENFIEIDDDDIVKAGNLGIAPVLYEQLEDQYNKTIREIIITKYKVKPDFMGGKAKRKTRKLKGKKRRQTKRNQKQRKKSI